MFKTSVEHMFKTYRISRIFSEDLILALLARMLKSLKLDIAKINFVLFAIASLVSIFKSLNLLLAKNKIQDFRKKSLNLRLAKISTYTVF